MKTIEDYQTMCGVLIFIIAMLVFLFFRGKSFFKEKARKDLEEVERQLKGIIEVEREKVRILTVDNAKLREKALTPEEEKIVMEILQASVDKYRNKKP